MSYYFPYKSYAREVLRELNKSNDPDIVNKFIKELQALNRVKNFEEHLRFIGIKNYY